MPVLIETIKNHPLAQVEGEKTLQDGAPSWSRQVDMPRIRALAAECRLINSRWIYRCDIAVLSPSPFSPSLPLLSLSLDTRVVSHNLPLKSPIDVLLL